MKKVVLLVAVVATLFSCKKENEKAGYFKGEEVAVYGGKTWSWVKLNKEGAPEQLAITLNDAALNSVPVNEGGGDGHSHESNFVVPLDEKAKAATPFQFVFLNWNTSGHEPEGIYTLPHFDIHFYMTTEQEVMNAVDPIKLDANPAADYVPPTYVPGPPVPMMGKHWIDRNAPELNGQTFTETFLYGSYDSKVTFYEPMITLYFLKNTPHYERSIPQPAKVQKSGYYPTKMLVVKHGDATEVVLDGFVYRQAS